MSKRDSGDLRTPGYFLPEDGQLRLAELREHIKSLVRQAQPHRPDEKRKRASEAPAGELTLHLEQLAEQVDGILGELSRFEPEPDGTVASERGSAVEAVEAAGAETESFDFGVTLDQIDELNRLVHAITAHGDVVMLGSASEFSDHTLSAMGEAIYDAGTAVHEILEQVQTQHPRVEDGRGVYVVIGVEVGLGRLAPARLRAVRPGTTSQVRSTTGAQLARWRRMSAVAATYSRKAA